MAKPTTFTCPSCQAVVQAVKVWEEIAHRDGGGVLVDVALRQLRARGRWNHGRQLQPADVLAEESTVQGVSRRARAHRGVGHGGAPLPQHRWAKIRRILDSRDARKQGAPGGVPDVEMPGEAQDPPSA